MYSMRNCFRTDIKKCAYYGSGNIFKFIQENYHMEITPECLHNAIIGGNTDIINECLKYHPLDVDCLKYAISSHNNTMLKYILDHDIVDAAKFDYQEVINLSLIHI